MKLEYAEMILAPLVTEKSTSARRTPKRLLCFKVHRDANKIMVKKAVEELFRPRSNRCASSIFQGKKRHGRYVGRRPTGRRPTSS